MSDSNYIKVYTGEPIVAQRIVSNLENADIIPVLKEQTDSGLTAIFGASNSVLQQIFVHKDEVERAIPIVERTTSELQD